MFEIPWSSWSKIESHCTCYTLYITLDLTSSLAVLHEESHLMLFNTQSLGLRVKAAMQVVPAENFLNAFLSLLSLATITSGDETKAWAKISRHTHGPFPQTSKRKVLLCLYSFRIVQGLKKITQSNSSDNLQTLKVSPMGVTGTYSFNSWHNYML